MATYLELRGLYSDDDIRNKTEVALTIAANEVLQNNDTTAPYDQTAGAHEKRVRLSYRAIQNTTVVARSMMRLVLAENNDQSVSNIQNAPDQSYLNNVKNLYDEVANGLEADEPRPAT